MQAHTERRIFHNQLPKQDDDRENTITLTRELVLHNGAVSVGDDTN